MKGLLNLLRFVWTHPLNQRDRLAALFRVFRWQVASRLMPGPIALPFVGGSVLLAIRGMTGASGNWYCGLAEFEDMALVLHALRPGELFVDIGANVGAYSVLAVSGGGRVIAIEPIPSTYNALQRNIAVNGYGDRVQALNIGLGRRNDTLRFSADCDTVNHVLADGEKATSVVRVPVKRLDDVLQGGVPVIIKIDVEGFETEVLAGAERTLANSGLLAVIMELNGSGERYGFDENALHRKMLAFGFGAYRYAPFTRELKPLDGRAANGNTLYVRNVGELVKRVKQQAPVRLGTNVNL